MDRGEESVAVSKVACPQCGKARAATLYTDGHHFCFAGCGYIAADGQSGKPHLHAVSTKANGDLLDPRDQTDPFRALSARKINAETMRRFGVFVGARQGSEYQVYPYHNQAGELVAQKLRDAGKQFPVLKGEGYEALGSCQLFGQHVFGDRFDRQVVVVEGELDAMSVAQELDFKAAVVSIGTGAPNAVANIKANYLWLDRFADIVLWFDNDEQGRKAMGEVAPLFKVGKVRIATTTGFKANGATPCKDASDVLQANRPGDIRSIIYAATAWRPKGIVNAKDNPEDVMAPTEEEGAFAYDWPWPEVTQWLGPILPGQVCYHVAGTGIGKSTAVATIAFHVMAQGGKVGYLSFEGTRREIKLALLVVKSGKRVDIEPLPDDQMRAIHEEAFGSGLMELFDPASAEWTMEAFEGYIRYLAKALDCHVIVADPMSAIQALLAGEVDERRALDKISMTLSVVAKELGVHVQVSHHLARPHGTPHEEGAATAINEVRGSGGMANFATFVIGHERNQQAPGDDWKLTQLRALKNRPRSRTGPMLVLEYSLETGQLSPTTKPFPKPGKPSGDKEERGFSPAGGDY